MLLDRPVIVIDCPELLVKARVSRDKIKMLRSAAEVVSAAEVAAGVERALADPLHFSEHRRTISDQLFFCPGGASIRASECIYDLLALPALPKPVPAPTRQAVEATAGFSAFETKTT
jgi:hypothetical protein